MTPDSLQVIFVDALFLCLAAGLALWFRSWLQEQQRAMDTRLQALEEQQQVLGRICERLTVACRSLERPSAAVDAVRPAARPERPAVQASPVEDPLPSAASDRKLLAPKASDGPQAPRPSAPHPAAADPRRRVDTPAAQVDRQWEELTDRSREAYRRARDLLEKGVPANDIARQVGLGVAEVNVLKRMRDAGRH